MEISYTATASERRVPEISYNDTASQREVSEFYTDISLAPSLHVLSRS